MKQFELEFFRSPADHSVMRLESLKRDGEDVVEGRLVDASGLQFEIIESIPHLIFPPVLPTKQRETQKFYDGRVDAYDENLHLTFEVHNEDECKLRNTFVDALELTPSSRVLEIAAGTGRDSLIIAQRLRAEGLLCVQDISPAMIARCRHKLASVAAPISFSVSTATALPFPDHYFDAVYSFGGLGEFGEIRRSLAEMARVARPGAKVVVGDESIPPWLRDTEFAAILAKTNPQFLAPLPLPDMPIEARDVRLRWVIGGVFYLIDFRVGIGAPQGNFDFPIPGPRGGTLRTRYEGELEGVTRETKRLAHLAREKAGMSMHDWLERVVRAAAERDLSE